MNEINARLAYEQWCKNNRRRKSEAGWELWLAAHSECIRSMPDEFREILELPQRQRDWLMEQVALAITVLKDARPPSA